MSESANPMSMPRISKVVVNIGVGEGGDRLSNAEKVLELVTGVTPVRTLGKQQNRDLKVRVGLEKTQSHRGISISLETYLLEFQIIQTSQNKNTIQISEFLEWTSISYWRDLGTVSADADAEVQRFPKATEPMLMTPEHGLLRIMVSKSWRSENGTRPW